MAPPPDLHGYGLLPSLPARGHWAEPPGGIDTSGGSMVTAVAESPELAATKWLLDLPSARGEGQPRPSQVAGFFLLYRHGAR